MRKFLRLVAVCVLSISLAIAQTASVKRNVVLRSKASSTSTAITTRKPPATLTLINPAARFKLPPQPTCHRDPSLL